MRQVCGVRRVPRRELRVERLEVRCLLAIDLLLGSESRPVAVGSACPAEPPAVIWERSEPVAAEPAATQAASQLTLFTRDTYDPGRPLLVRVQLEDANGAIHRDTWNATVQLASSNPAVTLSVDTVSLVNGLGSAMVVPSGSGPFTLSASVGELTTSRLLTPLSAIDAPTVNGILPGDATQWSGVVHVTGDVTVPADHVLTILPGTLVVVDGKPQTPAVQLGAKIIVLGSLLSQGTPAAPVTITASDPQQPWGELSFEGGSGQLDYTQITHAGSTSRGGHTNTGPALRLRDDANVKLFHSDITDIRGKILQASSGQLTIQDSLLSRAVMGPEIQNTGLDLQNSWLLDMAGRFHHNGTVDDNDGIYLHEQRDGQSITLRDSVIAGVQDDAVDTLGSTNRLEGLIIRDAFDKTISVFNGVTSVSRSLLVNADVGIEAKGAGSSTATVNVDRSTIAQMQHAVRAFDKDAPDPNVQITYNITNSILHVVPGGDAIYTDYDPADLHINYSWADEAWNHPGSGLGNQLGEPVFVDLANHDFHLPAGSPAIDGGDPTSSPDEDGTRADLGYAPVFQAAPLPGDFNTDGTVDATDIDLLCAAIASEPALLEYDLNHDGLVNETDLDKLLNEILQTKHGDANLDRQFDSSDLVAVFQAGLYEDTVALNAGWATGDWNCDGEFTTADLVTAFQSGGYVAG